MKRLSSFSRFSTFAGVILMALLSLAAMALWSWWFALPLAVFGALALLGVYDLIQPNHSILRNYPVLGHMRFLFEGIGPEIRQYLIEDDLEEEPFSRENRSLVCQRAKGQEDSHPSRHADARL